jgi:hypothetical protein
MENPTDGQQDDLLEKLSDVSEESTSLDDATIEPESVVEHRMDYTEAEAIESALAESAAGVSPLESLRDLVSESDTEYGGKTETAGQGVFSKARELPVQTTGEGAEPAPTTGDLSALTKKNSSESEEDE